MRAERPARDASRCVLVGEARLAVHEVELVHLEEALGVPKPTRLVSPSEHPLAPVAEGDGVVLADVERVVELEAVRRRHRLQ